VSCNFITQFIFTYSSHTNSMCSNFSQG